MSLVFTAQYVAFALSIFVAVVVGYRAYYHRDHARNMPVVWLSAGAIFILIGQGSALLAAYSIWIHLITSLAAYLGLLFVYWGLRHILYSTPPQRSLTNSIIFKIFLIFCIIAIALNTGRIITWIPTDKESSLHYPVELDIWPPFYWQFNTAFYFVHDFIQFVFLVLIVGLYTYTLNLYKNTAYLARHIICNTGFFIASVGVGAILLRIVFWSMGNDSQSLILIRTYQISKSIGSTTILIGFLTPHRFFVWTTKPIEDIKIYKQRQQYELLSYLHKKVIQTVPSVQLHPSILYETRTLIEISDARQFIWSYMERSQPTTAKEEARRILELLNEHKVIDKPGPYLPPKMKIRNVSKHYCAVARHLRRLENGA